MSKQLAKSPCAVDRLIAKTQECRKGVASPESLRLSLEQVFNAWPKDALVEAFQLRQYQQLMESRNATKQGIARFHSLKNGQGLWPGIIWSRRLALAQGLEIYVDILSLGADRTIPPHAHVGVVSGFFVVTGSVQVRHYQIEKYSTEQLHGWETVNTTLTEGQSTTNCDLTDNVHWLQASTNGALLFRINILNLPSSLQIEDIDSERLYVDPTRHAGKSGSPFSIPIVDKAHAASLRMT